MDGPRDHHTKVKLRPERERRISLDITYTWNLKKIKMNLFTNRNRLTEKTNYSYQRGGGERDKLGVWD